MSTRTVTGKLLDAKNLPLPNLEVTFKLSRGSFTPTANYLDRQKVSATTNAQGEFSIELWAEEEGTIQSRYICTMAGEKFSFNLPPGNSPVDIQFLRAQNTWTDQKDPSILAYIDQQIASGAAGGGSQRFEMAFTDSNLTVSGKFAVLHNRGLKPVSITVFNDQGIGLLPDDARCENLNDCVIDLASFRPLVGNWAVILGF